MSAFMTQQQTKIIPTYRQRIEHFENCYDENDLFMEISERQRIKEKKGMERTSYSRFVFFFLNIIRVEGVIEHVRMP
jgi:hypothetical protein